MTEKEIFLAVLLIFSMVTCVKTKKLTIPASFLAAVIGVVVFIAADLKGVLLLLVFFILSVLATGYKRHLKAKYENADGQARGRTAGQVFANGGVAAIIAGCSLLFPAYQTLFLAMMAASLASALSDTLSSELGTVYGRRFFNIITWKQDVRGLDGVVSMEGTLIGLLGSGIVALAFSGPGKLAVLITLSGFLGNLSDSIIGALLERKNHISNNAVNLLSTFFAAAVMLLFYNLI